MGRGTRKQKVILPGARTRAAERAERAKAREEVVYSKTAVSTVNPLLAEPRDKRPRRERRAAARLNARLRAAEKRLDHEGRATEALAMVDEGKQSWDDLDPDEREEVLDQRDRSNGPVIDQER